MLRWTIEEIEKALARSNSFRIDPDVVLSYAEEEGVSAEDADLHLQELKRYLILSAAMEAPLPMGGVLDRLWHRWMLHSQSYADFCDRVVGSFVHHRPGTEDAVAEDETRAWDLFRTTYQDVFGTAPNPTVWPTETPAEGSDEWWRQRLEGIALGRVPAACVTIGCSSGSSSSTSYTVCASSPSVSPSG